MTFGTWNLRSMYTTVSLMTELRSKGRWLDIKMNVREMGWRGIDWIDQAQDTVKWRAIVNTVMNFRIR
jgi:hypothetical protein